MYKQVILVRKDLKIGTGKVAAQVAHAALGSMRKVSPEIVRKWESEGSKKVVLKVKDLKELKDLEIKVRKEKIPYFVVKDAGLTQVKASTVTALGIGPIEDKKIDKLTRKLKLL